MNCGNCGSASISGATFCHNCGAPLGARVAVVVPAQMAPRPEGMQCAKCGTLLPAGKGFCFRCGAPIGAGPMNDQVSATNRYRLPPSSAPPLPPSTNLSDSLRSLGIRFSPRLLIGFGVSVVVGLIVARILPYIYPIIAGPILDVIFGPGYGWRDTFNWLTMTVITFMISFVISFIFSLTARRAR